MSTKVKTRKRIETTVTKVISAEQLCSIFGLPANARVFVNVPGGGDWSNTDLDLSDTPDQGLLLQYTLHEDEETEEEL